MSHFRYINKKLFAENVSVSTIVKKNKTPFYLYSAKQLKENYLNFTKIFKDVNPLVCFATKANTNLIILKHLAKLGAGADVVSGGELLKAIKAGIKPNKIVFSGVGKTEEELRLAIKKGILLINVESESEAILINKIAKKYNKTVSIGFRLNPDVDAKTHKKISTGKAENKFGLSISNFATFYKNIKRFKNLKTNALSVHIGSQILNDTPYKKTLNILLKVIQDLKIKPKYIDLGGGFGVSYTKKDKLINLKNYSKLVLKFKNRLNCNIIFEPGRSLVANMGVLVSKVQYIKKGDKKNFVILDAGMNDFMRPALYDANHEIIPVIKTKFKSKRSLEFVGPICETTCRFTSYKKFQTPLPLRVGRKEVYGHPLQARSRPAGLVEDVLSV